MFICTRQVRKCGNLLQDVRFKKKNSESESGNANYFNELAIVLARLFIFSKGKNLLLDVI
jgi:hypothetical protein